MDLTFTPDPPRANPSGRKPHPVTEEVIAACRAHPGQWTEFPTHLRWPDWESLTTEQRISRAGSIRTAANSGRGRWAGMEATCINDTCHLRYAGPA